MQHHACLCPIILNYMFSPNSLCSFASVPFYKLCLIQYPTSLVFWRINCHLVRKVFLASYALLTILSEIYSLLFHRLSLHLGHSPFITCLTANVYNVFMCLSLLINPVLKDMVCILCTLNSTIMMANITNDLESFRRLGLWSHP